MFSAPWQGLLFTLLVVSKATHAAHNITTMDVGNCACGFYDEDADLYFTESTIAYFNESGSIPTDFIAEEFEHRYDRGWNNMYRMGAAVDNVQIAQDVTARNRTSLELSCHPSDKDHLVVGSSIRTSRQDIFFGSFRASLRPARPWMQGSVISMNLEHNQTESWQVDVMNTDNSSAAWVDMLMRGQFADIWYGINFTNLTNEGLSPWYYTEYRVDWTRDSLNYYIGDVLRTSYNTSVNSSIPATPAPLKFQHWSLGNKYTSQGPPSFTNLANVAYARLFFNSSTWNDTTRAAYDERCSIQQACRMDDLSLRGASPSDPKSLEPWKQYQPPYKIRWAPLIIDIVMAAIFVVLTGKTLWRRFTWHKFMVFLGVHKRDPPQSRSFDTPPRSTSLIDRDPQTNAESDEGRISPASPTSDRANLSRNESFATLPPYRGSQTPLPQYQSPAVSRRPSLSNMASHSFAYPASLSGTIQGESSRAASRTPSLHAVPMMDHSATPGQEVYSSPMQAEDSSDKNKAAVKTEAAEVAKDAQTKPKETGKDSKPAAGAAAVSAKPPRVDYLAGFISISAVLVTANHFGLTYFSAVIIPGDSAHYQSETIARKTFATYFLDPLWIGPFLMISTRFLTSNYIRTGKLDNMAQKIVARPFRLLTPVASIAFLEYFLMDAGALNWLEYLPSVTWSDWPFTSIPKNPGTFISEIIQLAFLIPNAAPMITINYCTGVLWTIPVQLQGAWQTLLGLIMIRQIKTPWKRFSFYLFCTIMHWYALSWGSYYYVGILLADLDITYKYKQKWLNPRPWVFWPLLILMICTAIASFSIDLVTQHNGVNYAQIEYGWHPDPHTGLSLVQASAAAYPDYFIPRLNAFLATITMQGVVEISPTLQKLLSAKFLQWLFPHIFSIYLIHGFIMWSVGSWTMISMFSHGYPYWLCTLITAIVCYGTLFAVLPILTPPIEALGKGFTQRLWQFASLEPVERKPTTYPFGEEFLTTRGQLHTSKPSSLDGVLPSSASSASGGVTVLNEKDMTGKGKEAELTVRELKNGRIMENIKEF
ncbi:hypothetical protein TSTA_042520 [Talaromyces stipitatus ATCC 10500]|uniref:GH16 domain-containing protein n=1 Tax=Talaromyces stipitatus (strain ATCC 10500 / CBS 375.48 / QM 6759 / NRRL 1006) TaxID=441959 RepID=B8MJW1_TALSN|nr:uncharacterized protein TSTA_042520 [Talaromyces stipitatus ATCC 10500]EED14778.1 hypothetical protein TSTA_042520 [Talaromyces stipitatus ATCC 10500]